MTKDREKKRGTEREIGEESERKGDRDEEVDRGKRQIHIITITSIIINILIIIFYIFFQSTFDEFNLL